MEKKLRYLFESLTQETLNFIKNLEEEKYEDLDSIAIRRQYIIDDMQSLKLTPMEYNQLYDEFKLEENQHRLDLLFQAKRDKLKYEIAGLSKNMSAKKSYKKQFDVDPLFFNKKI
jgi:hypothetical protein